MRTDQSDQPDHRRRAGEGKPARAEEVPFHDWYAPGQGWEVETDGVKLSVRYVSRKGRRVRISAPPGAVFRSLRPKRA
jgi:hypothetical protein